MTPKEQIEKIRRDLKEQLKKLPPEKREEITSEVENLTDEELITFLTEQGMIQAGGTQKCIFCEIASKERISWIIDECEEAIAVLELRPLTKGHTLIIPKVHLEKEELISEGIQDFTKKVEEILKEKLAVKKIQREPLQIFGHQMISLIPESSEKNIERIEASEEELQAMQKMFVKEKEIKEEIKEEEKSEAKEEKVSPWIRRRVP